MGNIVYIGTSLDGYIADKNGSLDWLDSIPNPTLDDLGWSDFLDRVDALIMGKNTFETILGFGKTWPYNIPVFVLSNKIKVVPKELMDKVEIIKGEIKDIIESLNNRGFQNLYIDGGKTIQSFLNLDLIDELIITKIPILLGGGTPLFGELDNNLIFTHVKTEVYLDQLVKSHYIRNRTK